MAKTTGRWGELSHCLARAETNHKSHLSFRESNPRNAPSRSGLGVISGLRAHNKSWLIDLDLEIVVFVWMCRWN